MLNEGVRTMTILSYTVVWIGMFVLLLVRPGPNGLTKEFAVILLIFAGIFLAFPNVFGWRSNTFYPFPSHRRKAVVLWLYGLPIAIVVAALVYLEKFALWAQATLFVLTFVHLTTMAFGVLPYYGGAYYEYSEIMKRRDWASRKRADDRKYPDCNDSTYVSFEETCNTCLSAVLPEDNVCWRCGETIRWRKRWADRWRTEPKKGWKKTRTDLGTEWRKTWFPDGVRVTQDGEIGKRPIKSVTAIVDKRSVWSGWSDWTIRVLALEGEQTLLEVGMEVSPRMAREKVESILPNLYYGKTIGED